jgi:tetratricopeptide (TPR) repeat protein
VSLRQLAAWAHNRRGELLIDARQTQPALDEFQTAISLDAECSLAIHNRAVTLAQQNRPAEAIRDFNRVIELNPGLAVAFRNRAELFSTQNRFEEAVADYGRALEQLTEDAALYRSRAYALQRLGRIDGALADLNYAIRLSPAAPESYIQRGELAVERGDFNQAVRDLHRAVQLDPNEAEAYRSLAWLLATASNPRYRDAKQALELAKEAAALSPVPDPVLLDTLAASYASAGQFDMAVDTVRQAIAIAPTDFAVPLRARLLLYQRRQPFFNLPAAGVRTAAFEEEATRE